MLPKDFTPDVIEDPTKPDPLATPPPSELPQPSEPRSPESPFRVHPEPTPGDLPADPPFAPPDRVA